MPSCGGLHVSGSLVERTSKLQKDMVLLLLHHLCSQGVVLFSNCRWPEVNASIMWMIRYHINSVSYYKSFWMLSDGHALTLLQAFPKPSHLLGDYAILTWQFHTCLLHTWNIRFQTICKIKLGCTNLNRQSGWDFLMDIWNKYVKLCGALFAFFRSPRSRCELKDKNLTLSAVPGTSTCLLCCSLS